MSKREEYIRIIDNMVDELKREDYISLDEQDAIQWLLTREEGEKEIVVSESKTADTRSATTKVTKEVLLASSEQHIQDVQRAIDWIVSSLRDIAEKHDYTKLENIDEFYEDFKTIQEGSTENFIEMNWYKNYHLKERHHLDNRCPDDVNLFDVLERVADITTAGMARTGSVYEDLLSPELLSRAYQNTIELLKKNIRVNGEG